MKMYVALAALTLVTSYVVLDALMNCLLALVGKSPTPWSLFQAKPLRTRYHAWREYTTEEPGIMVPTCVYATLVLAMGGWIIWVFYSDGVAVWDAGIVSGIFARLFVLVFGETGDWLHRRYPQY